MSNKLFDCKIRTVSLGIRFEAKKHVFVLINSVISIYTSTENNSIDSLFSKFPSSK